MTMERTIIGMNKNWRYLIFKVVSSRKFLSLNLFQKSKENIESQAKIKKTQEYVDIKSSLSLFKFLFVYLFFLQVSNKLANWTKITEHQPIISLPSDKAGFFYCLPYFQSERLLFESGNLNSRCRFLNDGNLNAVASLCCCCDDVNILW